MSSLYVKVHKLRGHKAIADIHNELIIDNKTACMFMLHYYNN